MKTSLELAVREHSKSLVIIFVILCILGFSATIIVRGMSKPSSTDIFFNMESDLPDPTAILKNGRVGDDGINILSTGKPYEISFTVVSKNDNPTEYTYVIDSKILNKTDSFTLGPNGNKTFKYVIEPIDSNKWTYDRTDNTFSNNVYDLSQDSWLGERIQYEVISGETTKAYTYAPISINMGGYGHVLNLNVTLDELKAKPYSGAYTISTIGIYDKSVTDYITNLSVKNNKVYLETGTITRVYNSRPELFRITLYNQGKGTTDEYIAKTEIFNSTSSQTSYNYMPVSISFWYQIK
jgi:hypothetical protein